MCVASLFASCVQTDMFELYDEDYDCFVPRNKKCKESSLSNPYDFLNQSTFLEGECGAQLLKNAYPDWSNYQARTAIIKEQYGWVDEQTIRQYYNSVRGSIPDMLPVADAIDNILRTNNPDEWGIIPADNFNSYVDPNTGEYIGGSVLFMKAEGHVAKVSEMSFGINGNEKIYYFKITDQYGSGENRKKGKKEEYQITIDRGTGAINKKKSDVQFFWTR